MTDSRTLARPDISIVIAGNKCDLKDQRQVSLLESSQFAQENGSRGRRRARARDLTCAPPRRDAPRDERDDGRERGGGIPAVRSQRTEQDRERFVAASGCHVAARGRCVNGIAAHPDATPARCRSNRPVHHDGPQPPLLRLGGERGPGRARVAVLVGGKQHVPSSRPRSAPASYRSRGTAASTWAAAGNMRSCLP